LLEQEKMKKKKNNVIAEISLIIENNFCDLIKKNNSRKISGDFLV